MKFKQFMLGISPQLLCLRFIETVIATATALTMKGFGGSLDHVNADLNRV